MFPKHREQGQIHAHRPGHDVHNIEGGGTGPGPESGRADGKILQVTDHLESAIESALEQIAKLADSIEPVLSEDRTATANSIGMPPEMIVGEGDSAVAQRINELTNRVLEVARTIEALRRRVQL